MSRTSKEALFLLLGHSCKDCCFGPNGALFCNIRPYKLGPTYEYCKKYLQIKETFPAAHINIIKMWKMKKLYKKT
jgi:hypothetical protein